MLLRPLARYVFAALLFLYSAIQLWMHFIASSPIEMELLIRNSWLFGFAGWFVIIFALVFMSPAILYLGFALRYRNNMEGLRYHKKPVIEDEALPEKLRP